MFDLEENIRDCRAFFGVEIICQSTVMIELLSRCPFIVVVGSRSYKKTSTRISFYCSIMELGTNIAATPRMFNLLLKMSLHDLTENDYLHAPDPWLSECMLSAKVEGLPGPGSYSIG